MDIIASIAVRKWLKVGLALSTEQNIKNGELLHTRRSKQLLSKTHGWYQSCHNIRIFRPRYSTTYVDATCCYNPSSWSVTVVSAAKMVEPIEMPFGFRTWVDPRNDVLHGVHIPHGKGNFEGVGTHGKRQI